MVKFYNDLPKVAKILLQIFIGPLVSFLYRIFVFVEKKDTNALIGGILSLITVFIFWVIDLVTIITDDKIEVLA